MPTASTFEPTGWAALDLHGVDAAPVTHRGRRAVRLVESPGRRGEEEAFAVLPGSEVGDGVIEALVAGAPRASAETDMRGFVGVAFHVQPDRSRFECFFLRPTNGRAADQLRRNHSTQYMAHPDHPWYRLRDEAPGVYESYVDLVPGEWTSLRIVVADGQARLYVHGADQPCLVVDGLLLGERRGSVAVWIGTGTEAHVASVTVTPQP